MKFGFRTPSLSRSISARTTGRAKRAFKRALIPGYGKKGIELLTNPKKSIYNRIYRWTTFGLGDILKALFNLKSATKPFYVLLACTRPLITELSDKLRLKHPLLPTTSPNPAMRLETIRSIIPISCRRYPKSVWNTILMRERIISLYR